MQMLLPSSTKSPFNTGNSIYIKESLKKQLALRNKIFLTMGEEKGLKFFFNASHSINLIPQVCLPNSYKMSPIHSLPKTAIKHTWL